MMSSTHRYAIVTPYHKESRQLLERCIRSVQGQTVQADHFMVADGHPQDWIDGIPGVHHIRLAQSHADYGNTPRCVGAVRAAEQGYEAIGLLDADNWLDPDHVAACLQAASSADGPCDFVIAARRFCRLDGSDMHIQEEAGHIDTNVFFFLKGSYPLLPLWGSMPKELSPICDRVFAQAILSKNLHCGFTDRITVNYHCLWPNLYRDIGEEPPVEANHRVDWARVRSWLRSLSPEALREVERQCGCKLDPCTVFPIPGRAELDPFELGKTLFFEGIEALESGDWEEAAYLFRESLRHVPNRASTQMNLSAALIKLQQHEAAAHAIESALALEPDSPEAWLNKAILEIETDQLEKASKSLEQVKALDPYYPDAFLHQGLLHMKRGEHALALVQFDQALTLEPGIKLALENRQTAQSLLARQRG
ncbi:MAG: hypothetical protein RL758_1564 [Pseudomonadota bacterium]|jgi:tetratricopeptide (TPR) repeat protein